MTTKLPFPFPFAGTYRLTQGFGERPAYYSRWGLRGHNGLDWALPEGTPVLAVDDGRILSRNTEDGGYGRYVKLAHVWGESLYAHLSAFSDWQGEDVKRGQVIGLSGNTGASTGPHLHFGLRVRPFNAIDGWRGYCDPTLFLPDLPAAAESAAEDLVAQSEEGPAAYSAEKAQTGTDDTQSAVDLSQTLTPPAALGAEEPPAGAEAAQRKRRRAERAQRRRRGSRMLADPAQRGRFAWFTKAALRTWTPRGDFEKDMSYLALGLNGEAGEVGELVKKAMAHGHPLAKEKVKIELGDLLWYVAVTADYLGLTLQEVAEAVIDKLLERYPDGFDQKRSLHRKEGDQ